MVELLYIQENNPKTNYFLFFVVILNLCYSNYRILIVVGDWSETRPFRLPGILVGDGRLGGISSTISTYESLILRGYDVPVVIFEDNGLSNEVALLSYLKKRYIM